MDTFNSREKIYTKFSDEIGKNGLIAEVNIKLL